VEAIAKHSNHAEKKWRRGQHISQVPAESQTFNNCRKKVVHSSRSVSGIKRAAHEPSLWISHSKQEALQCCDLVGVVLLLLVFFIVPFEPIELLL
jgi:hypothetical protein